ncbi:MAG: RluA family pseudouridine synthase [Candidatus Omnitrophica bacterium]|nr:RluA family pseudouridine synthase [Candidatus Omnitrophota bacterium]
MQKRFIVAIEGGGRRLDKFLQQNIDSLSRTKINTLIKTGKVTVNGCLKKPSYLLKEKEEVAISVEEEQKDILKPYDFTVKIIYEDEDIIVVDKPSGLTVHPPNAQVQNTLINALCNMGKALSSVSHIRPGVVHRLDKGTSGVMVLAKNNSSHLNLIDQFKQRTIKKEYLAICWGKIDRDKLTVDLPIARDKNNRLKMRVSFIDAKSAYTEFFVIERLRNSVLFSIKPRTGRMHQIRVHLKFIEHPIIGDTKYGINDGYKELFLHAHKLGLYHPHTNEFMEFVSPMPERFEKFIGEHS